ncbi:succinate dehydrogenase assembly factor 2 [Paracoccus sp. SCSIO 75233]|uniref:succinate dehydrogenase assembly factor 2 n=1 Tax=Paracoccus sp. SCSIO 75233 TaxID=3017782 RepID=UPI0022F141EC|nr:succinate dehydrogenase assembly factor 2 [Paracoccus sp. SCSIO 75233]WBU54715.1 succinate dehydrogenase assembly factor 2 [Paracoccus sp. SCSIO 75233]
METQETRLKRLRMRSWRRGMKEMDLILGPFADRKLADLPDELMAQYEQVMGENDQDLYRWIVARSRGDSEGPAEISAVLDVIAAAAFGHFAEDSEHFNNKPLDSRRS